MATLLDSSVWIALFLDFDTHHGRAAILFERLRGAIYLPYGVLSETATVLTYKHSRVQAEQFLAYVADNQDITLVGPQIDSEIAFFRQLSARISFTDAALLRFAELSKARLLTFDRQLAGLYQRRAGLKKYR